ncbi:MAG: methylated-DNA--[protein]-cysteine S-methyltransferase [Ruminococcaceae bacterium]|nr:methylated-DNA--[protein]-cysteine S-methyltransferase [Oscillospiraceae bacterium]
MNSITVNTPIGYLHICEENGKIASITYKEQYTEPHGTETAVLAMAKQQLQEYFNGERKAFDLPLKITGSDFTAKVLTQLAKVPYGQTITYGQLAEKAGSKGAARAVGTVMRKNKFVIVLPCHRVLPQGNKLGNYSAGGPANKEWLLTLEKQNSFNMFFNLINQ